MRRLHLLLGIVAAVPTLLWASSGFVYALPAAAPAYGMLDAARVKVGAAEVLRIAGPASSLTLEAVDGRVRWSAIRGDEQLYVDAETGAVAPAPRPDARTRFFRSAHFFAANPWVMAALALAAAASALTGLWLLLNSVVRAGHAYWRAGR